MKITLIGTGAMYTRYNGASTLINDNLIIDMPNGTVKQLLKNDFDLTKIKTILVTHLHGDHTADIPFFIKYIFNSKKINETINIIGPKGTKEKIVELFNAYKFENEEEINTYFKLNIKEIEEEIISISDYKISSLLVEHGLEKPALGYIIDGIVGLTGDSGLCYGVEKIFNLSKIVISDVSLIIGDDCHLGIDNIKYLVEKNNVKVFPTHLRDKTRETLISDKINNVEVGEDFYEIII